ncbi:tetratricopeptide repeat protein [bacterium]|nr:tetratricopeptide repeat protein [bacterium]MCI0602779.1 tetratricopeptide repeat protein [bacterium]
MRLFWALLSVIYLLFASLAFSQDEEILILKDETEEASPQEPTETVQSPPERDVSSRIYLDFYETWRQFELQLKLGSVDQRLLADLIRLRNRNGIPKITEFALSAIRFGETKMTEGKPEQALQLFQAATSLDPSLSIAYYSQSKALLWTSWVNAPSALRTAFEGMFAPVSTLNGKIYLSSKYALIIIATLVILGCAFALIILAKYHGLLRHDTMEKYTSLTTTIVNLVVWIVLFLPILLLAGILWLAPFWFVIFWKYTRPSEKILSVVFFLAFMMAYPVYQYVVKISAASAESSVAPFIRVFSDGPSPRLLADFRDYSVENPKDSDGSIMLAHLYRAERNYPEAIKILQKHILDHPKEARVYNNLGHVYFLQGETDIALRMVQKAEDLDPASAIYPYNLSILLRAKFNFSDAEESLGKARRLDAKLIRKLEENPYSSMVDSVPTEEMILTRMKQKAGSFADYLANPFTGFSLLLLVLALVSGLSKKKDHAKECIKCGRPFCKRCQPAVKELRFCTQCLHIFVKKDGVSPASRKDKMREIEDHSRRQEIFIRVSSLVLPGFGNLYKNRIWFGATLLFFWFFFLVLIIYNWRFANVSFYESPGSTSILIPVFLLFLALLYLVANISLFRKAKA